MFDRLERHLWPDKPAQGASVRAGVKNRIREPSTWAATGQGAALLAIFFGPEQGHAIAGVIGALLVLYEVIRAERR